MNNTTSKKFEFDDDKNGIEFHKKILQATVDNLENIRGYIMITLNKDTETCVFGNITNQDFNEVKETITQALKNMENMIK